MSSKSIFDLAPGLEEKMNEILGKYEESLKRRQSKEQAKEDTSENMDPYKKSGQLAKKLALGE
jgi:hypothetical protein